MAVMARGTYLFSVLRKCIVGVLSPSLVYIWILFSFFSVCVCIVLLLLFRCNCGVHFWKLRVERNGEMIWNLCLETSKKFVFVRIEFPKRHPQWQYPIPHPGNVAASIPIPNPRQRAKATPSPVKNDIKVPSRSQSFPRHDSKYR